MLKPGDIFKTATGDVWYVESVTFSGAYCFHLSAHPTPITTRKGQTKIVKRHLRNMVFSNGSIVEFVDPSRLDSVQLKRRLRMARKEGTVMADEQGATVETAAVAPTPRTVQKYVRTEKVPTKEMRGQSKETMDALNGAAGKPLSVAEVAALCVYAGSRQDKERVAGFYLAQFKKDGLVAVAPPVDAPAETPAPTAV